MARIRSIKPEIHLDEELWDLEQSTGLPIFRAFTALWSQADREGRFEWRPRKLHSQCLPYWDGDFSRVLDALTTRAFVVRYACQGREYGCIRTFGKHQVINNREAPSVLPAPPKEAIEAAMLTRAPRDVDAWGTPLVHALVEGKGREGKGTGGGEARDARAPASGSPEVTDLPPIEPNPVLNCTDVAERFSALRIESGGGAFRPQRSDYNRGTEAAEVLNAEPDPHAALEQSLRNYFAFADRGLRDKNLPFWGWANDAGGWLTAKPPRGGGAPPVAPGADEYTAEEWGIEQGADHA